MAKSDQLAGISRCFETTVTLWRIFVPVRPGRNIGAIIEVAARNQLLKSHGANAALELSARLGRELARGRTGSRADVE